MLAGDIITLANTLSVIKINKITDKGAKEALLKDYLIVHRIAKMVKADKDETIRKFQEDWKDEIDAVDAQRREGKPVTGHDEYLEAEADAIKSINGFDLVEHTLYDKTPLEFDKVKADLLYNTDLWPDDISLGQIPGTIDFLIEKGLAE